MKPRVFLETFFRERLSRLSCASPTGRQLEAARDEVSDIRGSNPHALEERHMRYAMMVKVWASLSKQEQAVIFLQNAPTGPVDHVQVFRAVWPDALDDLDEAVSSVGAQVLKSSLEVRPRTHAEISTILGLTISQVRTRVRTANHKIANHPLLRSF